MFAFTKVPHQLAKRCNGELLLIKQLQNDIYITSQTSQFFVNLPIPEIAGFLQQAETMDYLELVKVFRNWVRMKRELLKKDCWSQESGVRINEMGI